jgi:hypothetical protein
MPVLRHRLLAGGSAPELLMVWISVPDLAVHPSPQRYMYAGACDALHVVRFESEDLAEDLLYEDSGVVVDYPGIAQLSAFSACAASGSSPAPTLVYPGATHTRFEHSIGVCHVARQIAAAPNVALDDDRARVVGIAALTHDLGHGPFSHVSERVIDERARRGGTHEEISVAFLRTDEQLRQAIGEEDADEAARVIAKEGSRTVLQDIVTGPTDADKLDYLLRDSRYAGVTYGHYDLGRILDTITVINRGKLDEQLGFEALTTSKQLALCLSERCLLRRAASVDLVAERRRLGGRLFADLTEGRFDVATAEHHVTEALGIEGHWVALYLDSRKNSIYRRTASAVDDRNAIMLEHPGLAPDSFEQTSELFSGGDVPAKFHLCLYVPRLNGSHPFAGANPATDDDLEELLWQTLTA